MSNVYVLDAVSDKVIKDLNDVNAHEYDLQELEGLNELIADLMVPVFFQYCENHNFGTDNELELKMDIKCFVDYINLIMIERLIPGYNPEEDLG